MSDFQPCPKRQRLTMFQSDGSKEYVHRCTENRAEMFNQNVEAADCSVCPIRVQLAQGDATKVKKPENVESSVPDTKTGEGFVPCDQRALVKIKACCGAKRLVRVCECPEADYFQGVVSPSICAHCSVRSFSK